jgi:hypothetical protein
MTAESAVPRIDRSIHRCCLVATIPNHLYEADILQLGETIASVRTDCKLIEKFPGIRLT